MGGVIACKLGVPLFFMISGALYLQSKLNYVKLLKKSIKYLFIYFLFNFLYFGFDACFQPAVRSPIDENFGFVMHVLKFNYWHLWFIGAYIQFLILLPMLKYFTTLSAEASVRMLAVLLTFNFVCKILNFYSFFDLYLPRYLSSDHLIYPVIGYYLATTKIEISWQKLAVLFVIILISFTFIQDYCLKIKVINAYDERIFQIFNTLGAPVMFLIFRKIKIDRFTNTYNFIGQYVVFIYLFHILFMWKLKFLTHFYEKASGYIGVSATGLLIVFCAFVLSLLTGILLNKLISLGKQQILKNLA